MATIITKEVLREWLTEMHREADPTEGDYDGYAKNIHLDYFDLLKELGLDQKWVIAPEPDENDYYGNFVVRPVDTDTLVPDIGDWSEEDPSNTDNIDEAVDFWWNFYQTGSPRKP